MIATARLTIATARWAIATARWAKAGSRQSMAVITARLARRGRAPTTGSRPFAAFALRAGKVSGA